MKNKISFRGRMLKMTASVAGLYLLAPTLDRRVGVLVSVAFALFNIIASRAQVDIRDWRRPLVYTGISVITYFILFNDQPWDFLFHGGMFDSSPAPLIVCCLIMSLAGGLLLKSWKNRALYALITLGLQVPVGLLIGTDGIQRLFTDLAAAVLYDRFYLESWAFWQFEWMLTYHLPFYFLASDQEHART